jgi:hypothetical protein
MTLLASPEVDRSRGCKLSRMLSFDAYDAYTRDFSEALIRMLSTHWFAAEEVDASSRTFTHGPLAFGQRGSFRTGLAVVLPERRRHFQAVHAPLLHLINSFGENHGALKARQKECSLITK